MVESHTRWTVLPTIFSRVSAQGRQTSTVLGASCVLSHCRSCALGTATAPLLTHIGLQAPTQQSHQSRGLPVRQEPIVFPPRYCSQVFGGPPLRRERPRLYVLQARLMSGNPGGRCSGHTLHPCGHVGRRLGTTRGGCWRESSPLLLRSCALVTGLLGHTRPWRGRRAFRQVVAGGGTGRPTGS